MSNNPCQYPGCHGSGTAHIDECPNRPRCEFTGALHCTHASCSNVPSSPRSETARSWSDEVCAIAHELGIEYAPDTGATHPGPLPALLAEIRELKERSDRLIDLERVRPTARVDVGDYDGSTPIDLAGIADKHLRTPYVNVRTELIDLLATVEAMAMLRERRKRRERAALPYRPHEMKRGITVGELRAKLARYEDETVVMIQGPDDTEWPMAAWVGTDEREERVYLPAMRSTDCAGTDNTKKVTER